MWRILLFFIAVTGTALGFSWLADRPGKVNLVWQGQVYQTELIYVVVGLLVAFFTLMLLWWLIKNVLFAPGKVSQAMRVNKREKGLDAISRGLIAVSAGDAALAKKLASKAGRKLQSDSLTTLLKAQAAQLSGDRNAARRLYETMLESPETEVAGLRGLYLEARREKEIEAARQFAQKAVQRNPKLSWSSQALLEIQSRSGQWAQALETLSLARKHHKIDKKPADRQRAVLLTAQALENEEGEMDTALAQALEAHKLAPDLVPAADVAGRILAIQGNVAKASKILLQTWEISPHPDLAMTYAHARPGDSPRDRLTRVQQLAKRTPYDGEGAIAVAQAAIESHDWDDARTALKGLLDDRPSERVCTLMARIEGGEFGDKGRVREWLARAVRAPRDPSWTADGYVSEHWAPVSPITGRLDAFEWKVPVERLEHSDDELPFEEFIPLKAEMKAEEARPQTRDELAKAAPAVGGAVLAAPDATAVVEEPAREEKKNEAAIGEEVSDESEKTSAPLIDPEPANDTLAKDDIEIIEAEPVEEPVKFDTPVKIDENEAERPDVETAPARIDPEIYIPPRMPDDPGPYSSTGSKNPKLPQRYRHSQKGN